MHTFFIWYPIYNPDKQSIPYTLNKWYTTLTSKLQKGLTELGNRSQRHYYSRRRPEKACMKKNPLGKKILQEIWVGTIGIKKQAEAHPTRLHS